VAKIAKPARLVHNENQELSLRRACFALNRVRQIEHPSSPAGN
jgi:hypothetical protein